MTASDHPPGRTRRSLAAVLRSAAAAGVVVPALVASAFVGPARAYVPGTIDTPYAAVGFDPAHAGLATANEQVDLFSGALNLSYTDHVVASAYGLPIEVVRTYSSKVVDETLSSYDEGWAGLGWDLHFGRFRFDATAGTAYRWIQLPGRGQERAYMLERGDTLYRSATDADAFPEMSTSYDELYVTDNFEYFYRAGADQYNFITTDGVVYVFEVTSGAGSDGWYYCTRIYNALGGEIAISYYPEPDAQPGAVYTVTNDAGGVEFSIDADGYLDSLIYTAADGADATVEYTVGNSAGPYVLTDSTTATGETTSYTYLGAYDELDSVTLSTGAVTRYSYDTIDFLWGVTPPPGPSPVTYSARVLVAKVVELDTATSYTWTYDFDDFWDSADYEEETRTTVVELPDGGIVEHEFFCYYSFFVGRTQYQPPQYAIGKPYATRWYDSAADTTPRRYHQLYYVDTGHGTEGNYIDLAISVSEDPFGSSSLNARALFPTTEEFFQDGTVSYTRQVHHGYTSAGDFDAFGNPYRVLESLYRGADGSGYATLTEYTYAWDSAAGADTLAAWNFIRLKDTETVGATVDGTSVAADAFREVSHVYETTTGFVGLPSRWDSVALPSANTSEDEYRTYTWSRSGGGARLDVSIDHGGKRTERRGWTSGTLARVGFERTPTQTLWLYDRDVEAATGLVTRERDSNGDYTNYSWDDSGRLLSIAPPLDEPTSIVYDFTVASPTATVTFGAETTTYTYDSLGRLVEVERPNGSGATAIERTQLDALGRPTRAYQPFSGSAGSYVDTTYDVLDRPEAIQTYDAVTGSSYTLTYSYNNLEVTVENPRGYVTTSVADGTGVPARTDAPAGVDARSYPTFTSGGLYRHGALTYVTDSTGAIVLQQVRALDQEDRLWSLYDGQSSYRYFVRDASGDVAHEYDQAGNYTVYTRNFAGKLTGVYFETSSAASAPADIAFYYDGSAISGAPAGWTYTNVNGRLSGIRDSRATEQYAYDDHGRVSSVRRAFDNFGRLRATQRYDYDEQGNVGAVHLSWAANRSVRMDYGYGPGGRVEAISVAVTNPSGTVTTSVLDDATYHPNGAFDVLDFGNGTTQRQTLDGLGRPRTLRTTGLSSNLNLTLTYDANGNVETVTDSGGTDVYTYDAVDRLTGVTYGDDGTAEVYTWDDAGNMTARVGATAARDFGGRAFTNNKNTAYTYDRVGNLTSDTSSTYGYDHRGRLTTASRGADVASVEYDHAGRRSVRAETVAGVTTYEIYLYDVGGRLLARLTAASLTATPVMQEIYVYAGGRPVAVVDYAPSYSNGRVHWLYLDHLGSVRTTGTGSGAVLATQEFYPFGGVRASSGSGVTDDHAFAGHERADGFGVADFGARSFHETTGSFVTPDRIVLGDVRDPLSFNRYAYGRMNPTTYIDPSGNSPLPMALVGFLGPTATAAAMTWSYAVASDPGTAEDLGALVDAGAAFADETTVGNGVAVTVSAAAVAIPWVTIKRGATKWVAAAVESALGGRRGAPELPALDATGKVHGQLPRPQDLGKYTTEELTQLRGELQQSVQKRIQVTVEKGSDWGHGERQGAEQQLIKSIEKELEGR